jgi:acetyltransferase-like isoleucine patch superfamily enzyme
MSHVILSVYFYLNIIFFFYSEIENNFYCTQKCPSNLEPGFFFFYFIFLLIFYNKNIEIDNNERSGKCVETGCSYSPFLCSSPCYSYDGNCYRNCVDGIKVNPV